MFGTGKTIATLIAVAAIAAVTYVAPTTAAPSSTATQRQNAALQRQVKTLRTQVLRQQRAIDKRNDTIWLREYELNETKTSLATETAAAARARELLAADTNTRISLMTWPELWGVIQAVYRAAPSGNRSYFASGGYASYSFNN